MENEPLSIKITITIAIGLLFLTSLHGLFKSIKKSKRSDLSGIEYLD